MLAKAHPSGTLMDAGNYLRNPEKTIARVSSGRTFHRRVAIGHVPYGLFRAHLPGDTRYVTILRDPLERVLSHYHAHMQRTPRDERPRKVTADSLQEAIDRRPPEICNLATRFLYGGVSPLGELPPGALDRAKANLREFEFVGITERFHESAVLMRMTLGLPDVVYERRHVSEGRPSAVDIPEHQRRLITETNALDIDLYAFARSLFDERARACEADLAAEAGRLSTRADAAEVRDRAALEAATAWLERELPRGTSMPAARVQEAARKAGISKRALRHGAKLAGILVERDAAGQRRWRSVNDAR